MTTSSKSNYLWEDSGITTKAQFHATGYATLLTAPWSGTALPSCALCQEDTVRVSVHLTIVYKFGRTSFQICLIYSSSFDAITTDIKTAFLMVGISNSDCDVLRFLWLEDPMNPQSGITQFN